MLIIFAKIIVKLNNWARKKVLCHRLRKMPNVHSSVSIGPDSSIMGNLANVFIGEFTYLNDVQLEVGDNSCIKIGKGCAIGYRVSIKARTHSLLKPTANDEGGIVYIEKDIFIGSNVWIGDGVYIREGVSIGSGCIVGANAVVTKSFPDNVVLAGVPARVVKVLN